MRAWSERVGEPKGVMPSPMHRLTIGWESGVDDDDNLKERAFTSQLTCRCMMSKTSSLVYLSFVLMSMTILHSSGTTLCCVPAFITVSVIFVGPSSSDIFLNL